MLHEVPLPCLTAQLQSPTALGGEESPRVTANGVYCSTFASGPENICVTDHILQQDPPRHGGHFIGQGNTGLASASCVVPDMVRSEEEPYILPKLSSPRHLDNACCLFH